MLKNFSKEEKSWILYDVANSAFVLVIVTTIMPIFFKDIAAFNVDNATSTAYWGFANSTASIILAILAPVLGVFADLKDKKKKFFTLFFVIGLIFTLALPAIGQGDWILCIIFFVVARVGWAGANLFYDSFITDVTENEKMDNLSASGFGWGYIGSVVPFLFIITLVMFWKTPDQTGAISLPAARISFLIVALWWFLFTIPLLKNVNQRYFIEPGEHVVLGSFKRLYATFKEIKQYKNIGIFLLAYFFYIDGVGTIISMSAVYGREVGLSTTLLIVVILMIQIVAFPFALFFGKLASRFSAKKMIYVGIFIYGIITFLGFLLPVIEESSIQILTFWVMAFLVASSQGGIQALSRSFYGKLIPKEKSSEFFGFFNIFGRFAAIIGPTLMGVIGIMTGSSRWGLLGIFILFIIGALILIKVEEPA
ncbi:MAG: MFS transporter [Spirochaetaceae bacterium]|jgi:UMF1 family MFS transporter|nr:MFS transporter [Spirochaetaceae bacterium]